MRRRIERRLKSIKIIIFYNQIAFQLLADTIIQNLNKRLKTTYPHAKAHWQGKCYIHRAYISS